MGKPNLSSTSRNVDYFMKCPNANCGYKYSFANKKTCHKCGCPLGPLKSSRKPKEDASSQGQRAQPSSSRGHAAAGAGAGRSYQLTARFKANNAGIPIPGPPRGFISRHHHPRTNPPPSPDCEAHWPHRKKWRRDQPEHNVWEERRRGRDNKTEEDARAKRDAAWSQLYGLMKDDKNLGKQIEDIQNQLMDEKAKYRSDKPLHVRRQHADNNVRKAERALHEAEDREAKLSEALEKAKKAYEDSKKVVDRRAQKLRQLKDLRRDAYNEDTDDEDAQSRAEDGDEEALDEEDEAAQEAQRIAVAHQRTADAISQRAPDPQPKGSVAQHVRRTKATRARSPLRTERSDLHRQSYGECEEDSDELLKRRKLMLEAQDNFHKFEEQMRLRRGQSPALSRRSQMSDGEDRAAEPNRAAVPIPERAGGQGRRGKPSADAEADGRGRDRPSRPANINSRSRTQSRTRRHRAHTTSPARR